MRALWNAPGFTATATATMALAIGSVVAIYSLYARVALHPLAVERPESLVSLYAVNASANFVPPTLSWPRFEFIAGETTAFEYLGAYSADSVSLADPDGPAEQLSIWRVSDDFFRVWGGRAALGRLFLPEENLPNGPAVCVLTEEFWRSRFGGRNVIGERIELNGVPTEIVGILTPNLPVPWHGRQIFLPRIFEDSGFPAAGIHAGASFLHVVGRLRDGVGRDQLTAELEANSASYRESFGAHGDAANDVNVEPLVDAVVGERKSTFTALVGAALAVLAIACANVAALYLGWRAARQRETAIRAALGASRWRLVAEIFGEALTIAALAGVVGTIIAAAALFALSDLLAAHLPSGTAVRLDPSAAAVGIFSVVASMCVIGLGPILKLNALGNLTTAQRGSSTSIAGSRFRAGLVVAETALSVALLVVAILLLVSLARLLTTSPGFDGTQVAAGYVNLPSDRYDSDERNLPSTSRSSNALAQCRASRAQVWCRARLRAQYSSPSSG